jgi:hypothetical protein
MLSSVDCITTTSESEFLVHTGGRGFAMGGGHGFGMGGGRGMGDRLAFHGGGRFHVVRFNRGFRGFGFYGGPIYAYNDYSCWQWYPGRYGYVRIWLC